MLYFNVVAVLVDRLSWLEFLSGRRVVELGPKIRDGENGISTFKGCHKRLFVVQVAFDYLDTFGGPRLGFRRVAGYAADLPARLFDVEVGDGAAL